MLTAFWWPHICAPRASPISEGGWWATRNGAEMRRRVRDGWLCLIKGCAYAGLSGYCYSMQWHGRFGHFKYLNTAIWQNKKIWLYCSIWTQSLMSKRVWESQQHKATDKHCMCMWTLNNTEQFNQTRILLTPVSVTLTYKHKHLQICEIKVSTKIKLKRQSEALRHYREGCSGTLEKCMFAVLIKLQF